MIKNIKTIKELNDLHIQVNKGELVIDRNGLLDLSNKAISFLNTTNDETEISLLHAIRHNIAYELEKGFQL